MYVKSVFTILTVLALWCTSFAQTKTENVFIITLDGLRWQEMFSGADSSLITNKTFVHDPVGLNTTFWSDNYKARRTLLFPFFWNTIAKEGQIYGNRKYKSFVNVTNTMWFSYPGYSEILCGYADDARIKTNNKFMNPNTTVLEFINKAPAFKNRVAAFGSWDVFPYIVNEERSGIPVNAGFDKASGNNLSTREKFLNELIDQVPSPWATVRLDAFTHHYVLEYLKRSSPRVVYIAYGETDDFAHDGKYDAYLKSAHQSDQFIKELWGFVQSTPVYKGKTTFIITTDHGRGSDTVDAWKNHGHDIPGAGEIWFAVIGPDTPAKGEVKTAGQYYQNQLAKTAATLLRLNYVNMFPVGEPVMGVIRK